MDRSVVHRRLLAIVLMLPAAPQADVLLRSFLSAPEHCGREVCQCHGGCRRPPQPRSCHESATPESNPRIEPMCNHDGLPSIAAVQPYLLSARPVSPAPLAGGGLGGALPSNTVRAGFARLEPPPPKVSTVS